jgi:two-component system, cell cycle sensor histidine kinase and response regulator CckA
MPIALRVLIVEDSEDDALLLLRELRRGGYAPEFSRVFTADALRAALGEQSWDLVLSDFSMPQFSALAALEVVRERGLDLPFIIVSGTIGEESAVTALKSGAHDFVVKGHMARLLPAIERELREAADRRARRQVEEALRESEDRFRRLAENALDVIYHYRLAPSPRVEYISPAAAEITGYAPEEYYADPLLPFTMLHPEDRPLLPTLAQAFGRPRLTLSLRMLRKDGTPIWTDHRVVPVYDASGALVAVEGIARDVTERRRLEAQFLQSQKMEGIGRLAGGVAHDFNNLLTAIVGYVELALDELPTDHVVRSDLEEVRNAAVRATSLTRQLLTFARKQSISPESLDLNHLIRDVEKLLGRLIGADVELVTALAGDLWQVRVDPGQIEQVLVNLAVNARDAMPYGGRLTIETANLALDEAYLQEQMPLAPGEYVLISVSDTGVGMTDEVRRHLFEPFFSTKTPDKGTGLGLATCYGIVSRHGGGMWAYGEPGQGATFRIYLPRASGAPDQPPRHVASEGPADMLHGAETLLLVEDEPGVRGLTARVLRSRGYTVVEAGDGEEALRLAQEPRERPIELLLTDAVLPRLGGRALVEQIVASLPLVKVLVMSGYPDHSVIQRGLLSAEMAFLQKPFSPTTLLRKVREVLDS